MYRTYNTRPLPKPRQKRRSRIPWLIAGAFFVLLAGYVAYALLRALPAAHTTIAPPVLPGQINVSIPWPTAAPAEQAAFGADGYGLLASNDAGHVETPVPTASIAKVITAMAVLQKKPLKAGETGPSITMTSRDVTLYNQYVARDGSVVPVFAGETINEYQALQAMLLPSANNIADGLAEWAFGSLEAYNTYANSYVRTLGMDKTTVTDASGFAATTVSTASDLVRLGDAALDNPVLSEIVNQKTADFPEYGTIRNVNALLGQSGIRGIKTGNTDEAGGCFLTAADIMVGDQKITVIAAVMSAPDLPQALRGSLPLIQSAPSQFQTVHAVRAGQAVGSVSTSWGASSDIVAAKDISVTHWSGTAVASTAKPETLTAPAPAHSVAGQLVLKLSSGEQTSDLYTLHELPGPDMWWRLSHPF